MEKSSEFSELAVPDEDLLGYQSKRFVEQKLGKEKEPPSTILRGKAQNLEDLERRKSKEISSKKKMETRRKFKRQNKRSEDRKHHMSDGNKSKTGQNSISKPQKEISTTNKGTNDARTYSDKINSLTQANKLKTFFLILCIILSLANCGYNDVIGNVLTIPLTKHVYKMTKEEQVEQSAVFYVCLSLGSVLAAMAVSVLATTVGRVRGLFLIEACKIATCALMSIKNIKIFMGMVLVSGFLAGVQENMVMIMMRELVAPKISDKSGFLYYITASSFAAVAGYMGVLFGNEQNLAKNWRAVILWPSLISLISFSGVFSVMGCSDTPQYYVETIKDVKSLRAKILTSMRRIYEKKSAEKYLEYKLFEVKKKAKFEEAKRKLEKEKDKSESETKKSKKGWRTLLKPRYMTQMVLGTSLSMLKELAGISMFLYFSTQFFDEIFEQGEGASLTFILSTGYMAGAFLSYFSIMLGRRGGMLITGVIHSLALLVVILGSVWASWWTVAISIFIYTASYTPGHGSILRVYLVEILPPSGISVVNTLKWILLAWLCAVIPGAQLKYGALAIMEFHFFFSVIVCVLIYLCVFETSGLSNEEIEIIFLNQKSVFNFGKRDGLLSDPPTQSPVTDRRGNEGSGVVVEQEIKGFETDRTQNQRLVGVA